MKKKILVVENDKEILNIISYLLNDEGYEVKSLSTISGLLNAVKAYKPDAILLDIIIPGVEDSDVCKTIKTHKEFNHIPLIVLSTHPTVAATIKDVCADEVISKPFDIEDLLNVIGDQLAA